jgi:hydrogenase maturation protease
MTGQTVPSILVAACGNTLAGDDAFGPLVARQLALQSLPGVEVVDLGMRPAGLIDHLADRHAVILVDAALCEGRPAGELLELDFFAPDRPALCADRIASTHAFSVAGQLELAQALGMLPPVVRLVALTAESTHIGTAGAAAQRQLNAAVALIVRRIGELATEAGRGKK